MTERRGDATERGAQLEVERIVASDFQVLRRVTDRDLPSLGDTERLLRDDAARNDPRLIEEGIWMKSRRILSTRPWWTGAAVTAVIAAILGIIPVSYERTTGHEVALTLAGPASKAPSLAQIAGEFKRALAASEVRVSETLPQRATVLEVLAPSRSRAEVERTVGAFAAALAGRGIRTQARISPRTQRLSSNVYAMALNRVIELRIERAGKTSAEIEADVRAQLEAAGLMNPEVHVTQDGGVTQVQIQAQSESPDEKREFKINLGAGGTEALSAQVHRFEVERKPGMSDAEIKAEVERQMREAGVDGEVTVQNGEIRVEVRKKE